MKTLYITLITLFCFQSYALAQKENNVWVYGDSSGIDFNSGSPVSIKTSAVAWEGSASISDTFGNLLFYNDSRNIFDRTHTKMPGSTGLIKNTSSTQATVIVPIQNNQYYVFGVDEVEVKSGRFFYHRVDMTLNSGYGDIVTGQKNLLLADSIAEKICVVPTCDAIWVIVHHLNRPIFYAYKVLYSGVIESPVISTTDGTIRSNFYCAGGITVSNNYKMIAISYAGWGWGLFNFDSRTGIVDKTPIIDALMGDQSWNFEFSYDDSKLYISAGELRQYDLSLLPSSSAVLSSKYSVAGSVVAGMSYILGLRRGPDKKIYFLSVATPSIISCINKPELAGAACDVTLDIPSLKHKNTNLLTQLGNNIVRLRKAEEKTTTYSVCEEDIVNIETVAEFESFLWNDGDTSGEKILTGLGKYWRQSYRNYCVAQIDTYILNQKPFDTSFTSSDTALCFKTPILLSGRSGMSSYLWDDGEVKQNKTLTESGLYWVISEGRNCKAFIDTFKVIQTDFDLNLQDRSICKGDTIHISADNITGAVYTWQDGSERNNFTTQLAGKYWLKISLNNCSKTDTFTVTEKDLKLELGTDKEVCEKTNVVLSAVPDATYLWNTGSIEKDITVNISGKYSITVKKDGCTATDSVTVTFKKCENCIFIPNAFTPNKDNKNDLFGPLVFCPVQKYEIIIMNRYGEKVFSSTNPNDKWNGEFNNKAHGLGVYYYLIKVIFDYPNAKEEILKGDISLLN